MQRVKKVKVIFSWSSDILRCTEEQGVSCDHAQLSERSIKNIHVLVKRAAIVWKTSVCWQVHYTFCEIMKGGIHMFSLLSLYISLFHSLLSLSLQPSLSKQASRQSVQSSLLIANSHGWVESQLFPSALSMLHFSSYPLLPLLTALTYSLTWFQKGDFNGGFSCEVL